LISTSVAPYNAARFIRAQLNSISAQTVLSAELVVTDDGSSDNARTSLAAFAQTALFSIHSAYAKRTQWILGHIAALVDFSCLIGPRQLLGALTHARTAPLAHRLWPGRPL
jgi:GT2 family glycosyltransferase